MQRQAMVLIADEIFFNLYGKAVLHGIYNNDLVISRNPSVAAQLVFYFTIETDITDPFQSLSVEVSLPEAVPVRHTVFIPPHEVVAAAGKSHPERVRYYARHPLLIPNPVLKPGRIEAKVIHEKGEIPLATQWITFNETTQTVKAN